MPSRFSLLDPLVRMWYKGRIFHRCHLLRTKTVRGQEEVLDMRMLLHVTIPHEPFNTLVRENKVGALLERVLKDLKPEAVYFTEEHGKRAVVLIIDVAEPSKVPSFAEPFFLQFDAECRFRVVMTEADLSAAGLDVLAKKWH